MLPESAKYVIAAAVFIVGVVLIYRHHRWKKQAWWLKRYNFREAKERESDRHWNS